MRRFAFCIAVLPLVACSSGDTLFGDRAATGGGGADTSATSTTGASDGGGAAQATGPGQGGAASASGAQSGSGGSAPDAGAQTGSGSTSGTTASTGSGEPAAATGASTGSGGALCTPKDADSLCAKCAKEGCCQDLTACVTDMGCACWLGCTLDGNPGYQCDKKCNTYANGKKISFETCTKVHCWQACN